MFIPYSSDTVVERVPVANIIIISVCVIMFLALVLDVIPEPILNLMILDGWQPLGFIGHLFLHAGLFHLLGNMLYLWIFGNPICDKLGAIKYFLLFFTLGVIAAVFHLVFDGGTAVGASGAINGIIGFYIVLFPVVKINIWYWFWLKIGTFEISGYIPIAVWFALDAYHAFSGAGVGIAYWAHVGGFLGGVFLGAIALKTGIVKMAHYDSKTLLDRLGFETTFLPAPKPPPSIVPKIARDITPYEQKPMQKLKLHDFSEDDFNTHSQSTSRKLSANEQSTRNYIDVDQLLKQKTENMQVDCPHCYTSLTVPIELVNREFLCPNCNEQLLISQ